MQQLKDVCLELAYTFEMQGVFCSLEPEWAAAATEVKEQTKGKVKLAAVDATVNQVLASRYGVSMLGRLVSLGNTLLSAVAPSCIPGLPRRWERNLAVL